MFYHGSKGVQFFPGLSERSEGYKVDKTQKWGMPGFDSEEAAAWAKNPSDLRESVIQVVREVDQVVQATLDHNGIPARIGQRQGSAVTHMNRMGALIRWRPVEGRGQLHRAG